MKILYLVTEDWYFCSHRMALASAAKAKGHEVLVAARVGSRGDEIRKAGFKLIPIRLRRSSRNPFSELAALLEILSIYRRERPRVVHQVALKPVLYGSIAARLCGVPIVVNALAGLGHVFVSERLKTRLAKRVLIAFLRFALQGRGIKVIFQNEHDRRSFLEHGISNASNSLLIRGSGVCMERFKRRPEPEGAPVVMYAGRLLWTKGVGEVVETARRIRESGLSCRTVIVGMPDEENPDYIPENTIKKWMEEGLIEWWGQRDDMPDVLARSNIVVLPSRYGEGVPKVLIESAAIGRAIVATDIPGCSDIVKDKVNGLLVEKGNITALVEAVSTLIRDRDLRARLGSAGPAIVAEGFAQDVVVKRTLTLYEDSEDSRRPETA